MSERRLRIGVLGAGAASQVMHLPILRERRDVQLVAVADPDRSKAEAIAERFGIRPILDDQELLAMPDLDGVVVCTPNYLHERQAIAALEAGAHVLVERPLALSAEGASRIVEAARTAGRTVVVGMPHRFRADVAALKAFIAGGELGDVYGVRATWLNRTAPLARIGWRQRLEEAGGGALMDVGVQAMDLCLYLLGGPRVERVTARTVPGQYDVEDAAMVQAYTEGGTAISLTVTWRFFGESDYRSVRVLGTEGSGRTPPLSVFKQVGGRPIEVTPRQPWPRGGEDAYTNSYRRELDHFVRAITSEADAPLPTEQVDLMAVIEGAYRSAEEGREVALPPE